MMKNYDPKIDQETITPEELEGTSADPEEEIVVDFLNVDDKIKYRKEIKRKELYKRIVSYKGTDGEIHIGRVIGFDIGTGSPVLYCKDDISPADEPEILFLENYEVLTFMSCCMVCDNPVYIYQEYVEPIAGLFYHRECWEDAKEKLKKLMEQNENKSSNNA